ncbi:MAG: HAMP domain-containing histidine kinase [Deltaproteobacteria bacterium]|nr:HAMP domain-containing histidine kinase [Deltaproteobacteria bacterium]
MSVAATGGMLALLAHRGLVVFRAAPANPSAASALTPGLDACIGGADVGFWGALGRSWGLLLLVLVVGALWWFSGHVARRIARPLRDLTGVAECMGRGQFSLRAHAGAADEVGVLAHAFNELATRIERQMSDQRALLAAVSHELRTPLGHLRLLLEFAREEAISDARRREIFDEAEREVVEIDALVGELLASSKLDFTEIATASLDACEVARAALSRAGLSRDLLAAAPDVGAFEGDATLVARALANLIANATRHGGGVDRLCVTGDDERVTFVVDDRGHGIDPADLERVFEPFYRRPDHSGDASPGLGLSLVRRIAEAHGGFAEASNRAEGGARVSITLPRRMAVPVLAREPDGV